MIIITKDKTQTGGVMKASQAIKDAAPEMLEVLEYLESILSEEGEEVWELELNRIRTVIAKATKETK